MMMVMIMNDDTGGGDDYDDVTWCWCWCRFVVQWVDYRYCLCAHSHHCTEGRLGLSASGVGGTHGCPTSGGSCHCPYHCSECLLPCYMFLLRTFLVFALIFVTAFVIIVIAIIISCSNGISY